MRNYDPPSQPTNLAAERYKAEGIRIVAIGDAQHDRATDWAKFQYPFHILVKNVDDLVTKVIAQCLQLQTRMQSLVIIGHGSPGHQQIGYAGDKEGGEILSIDTIIGAHWEKSFHRRKRVYYERGPGKHRESMSRLIPFFMPGAEVILGGCDVGEEPEVARALAQLLHVKVVAYSAQQVIPFNSVWVGKETAMGPGGALQQTITSNLPFHVR